MACYCLGTAGVFYGITLDTPEKRSTLFWPLEYWGYGLIAFDTSTLSVAVGSRAKPLRRIFPVSEIGKCEYGNRRQQTFQHHSAKARDILVRFYR